MSLAGYRLRTFLLRGAACAGCGLAGDRFRKERGHPGEENPHLNLYARALATSPLLRRNRAHSPCHGVDCLP